MGIVVILYCLGNNNKKKILHIFRAAATIRGLTTQYTSATNVTFFKCFQSVVGWFITEPGDKNSWVYTYRYITYNNLYIERNIHIHPISFVSLENPNTLTISTQTNICLLSSMQNTHSLINNNPFLWFRMFLMLILPVTGNGSQILMFSHSL